MNFLLVLFILAALLFGVAFVTNRRFGILGLALFAGSYLAHSWTGAALPFIEQAGVDFTNLGISTAALVGAFLTILPSVVLLANSPKYSGQWPKIIGSVAYALLACVLLVPLLKDAIIESSSAPMIEFITENYTILVTIGLIASILDLFLSRSHKTHKGKDGKHSH